MNGLERMNEQQRSVTDEVMAQACAERRHLVVHLSGAHAYGFPSTDSDLDLKAIHIAPSSTLLGFGTSTGGANHLGFVRGVEVDYTSNELSGALKSLINGDGNMLERVLAKFPVVEDPALASLRELMPACLSKAFFRHYRGFASSQRKRLRADELPQAKKLLYVLRTALTGAHLLLEGDCEPDLLELYLRYEFPEVPELVALKQDAEKGSLPPVWTARVEPLVARAFECLEQANARSSLPDVPAGTAAAAAVESWMLSLRKSFW